MIVLKRNKVLQEIIGLGGYEDRNLSIKTRQSICINLYRYMNNAKVATELMFCAAIYVIVLSSLFTVIRNCDTVRGFYFDIEDLANSSKLKILIRFFFNSILYLFVKISIKR